MISAEEARKTAEEYLKSGAKEIFDAIDIAAKRGRFSINVDNSKMNIYIKQMLEEKKFKVTSTGSGSRDNYSSFYLVEWVAPK